MVYSTDRSKAVVPALVLLFVAFCGLFYEVICFMSYLVFFLFLCFSVLLALRLPRMGKWELILVLFVRLFDLCLFGFVCFLFLLVSGKGSICDCSTSWTFLLFFLSNETSKLKPQRFKRLTLTLWSILHPPTGVRRSVWDAYTNQKRLQLEKVQRIAARWATNN